MFDENMKAAIKKKFGLEVPEAQKKAIEILGEVGLDEGHMKRWLGDMEFVYGVLAETEKVRNVAKSVDLKTDWGASVLYMALCP